MYQIQNNLAIIYDQYNENEIVNVNFDLPQQKLNISCTCSKGNFCKHTDYMVDFIYNTYFHYDEIGPQDVKIYKCNNKLWLPCKETDNNENEFIIDVELLYSSSRFNYYCSYCCPGVDTVHTCRHLDYIIFQFAKHYHELKEQNDEINEISFDSMRLNDNDTNMDIEN